MTDIQEKMQALIRREELDRAFDARFLRGMKEKFLNARVAVAGLGGLGSNIAVMLARSGWDTCFLVDFDTVGCDQFEPADAYDPTSGKTKGRGRCRIYSLPDQPISE